MATNQSSTPAPAETVTVTIDGRTIAVPKGTTVYHAAQTAGVEIPIFCYHDRMPPLGACRMCLVKVEKMPKLQTSCTLTVADGMSVDTISAEVKAGQEAILEFLLINHPLDCPICDKGGECPLQDQTFRWGPGRSRYVEPKRDFAKPVSLGPVLTLDRERCILCWRCVRFGEIVAGDDALKGFERGFTSEINTPFTLPVESKFIGNTISICPVGALTSKTYRFRARPWDNQPVASTCTHCGVGCATWFDVRDGEVLRTRAREDKAVNDVWLCDRGFFGHDYIGSQDRLTTPLVRRGGQLQSATWDDAIEFIAAKIEASRAKGLGRAAFLGGRRLTNEDAAAAGQFFREIVGTPHLDHRVDAVPDSESLRVRWGLRTSLDEIAAGDVFVLIGTDLTEEYPVLWLRVKPSIDRGAALVIVNPKRLEIARYARHERLVRVDALAATVEALAGGQNPVSTAIANGRRVHVFVGRMALDAPRGAALLGAAVRMAARANGTLHVLRGHGNDFGAQHLGLVPGSGGWTAPEILTRAAAGALDILYVAGSDPATAVTDRDAWAAARAGVDCVIVHDAFLSATAKTADVVLPALVLPEKDGTVMNVEGRVLELRSAAAGPGQARSDREVFLWLAARLGTQAPARALMPTVGERVPIDPVTAETPAPAASGAGASGGDASVGAPEMVLVSVDTLFTQGEMTRRCRGITDLAGAPSCAIHPHDASRLAITDRALVEVSTPHGALVIQARVSDETPPGQILVPRGYDYLPVHALFRWPHATAPVEVRPLLAVATRGGR
jgi:NADH-quinone oxidoreductase subunit G